MSLRAPLNREATQVLFRSASAVLANSGHEPFGLVGLEAMAAGGLVCTGSTGEDYAIPGWNALVLQSNEPQEFVMQYHRLRANAGEERAMTRRAQHSYQPVCYRFRLKSIPYPGRPGLALRRVGAP